jgi:hypothetical protein
MMPDTQGGQPTADLRGLPGGTTAKTMIDGESGHLPALITSPSGGKYGKRHAVGAA